MKRLAASALLYLWALSSLFAQNWAPFNVKSKTVFASKDSIYFPLPDSVQKPWIGYNLALVRFDTVYTINDTIKYLCHSCQDLNLYQTLQEGFSKSGLFGYKVSKFQNTYFLGPNEYSSAVLLYKSKAEVGDTILKGIQTCYGLVTGKTAVDSGGIIVDSIKNIRFGFQSDLTIGYTILLSKRNGFLSFPSIFNNNSDIQIYTRYSNYEKDNRNIKSFSPSKIKYKTGDQLATITKFDSKYNSPYFRLAEDITYTNSVVLNCDQDSCLLSDTTRLIKFVGRIDTIWIQTRKIANQHSSHQEIDYTEIDYPISSGAYNYSISGFLRSDSILFIGRNNGFFEGGSMYLLSSQFPFGHQYKNTGGGGGGFPFTDFHSVPAYFKRGDTIIGKLPNIHFPPNIFSSVKKQNQATISIFPNPAAGSIYPIGLTESGKFTLIDSKGQKVLVKNIEAKQAIDISSLSIGLYFFNLESGGKIYSGKIVKD